MTPWPIIWTSEGGASAWAPETVAAATAAAQQLLAALSGGIYGITTYSEAYRVPDAASCLPRPYRDDLGNWRNAYARHTCCELPIAHRPVRQITEVRLYGVAQDPSTYRYELGALRRRGACWPSVATCDDPVIEVDYIAGRDPASAAAAMGELAAEFANGIEGRTCRLPSSVVSVTRQGVTYQLADPTLLTAVRKTGLPLTDAWLDSVNPRRRSGRSKVISPDVPERVR